LGDCLARIRHKGDTFVVVKNDKPVAELGPITAGRTTLRAIWDAWAELPADPAFAKDLERVNRADEVMDNPWA
jgi:hypothetical protein